MSKGQQSSGKCRGTRDMLPADMARFRHIEDIFRERCTKWGYEEVRTPTLEYMHLFTSTGTLTPAMLGKVYSFLDWDGWSGERVVLRPDCTIPVARVCVETAQAKPSPLKLFYVTNVFAFEETGLESREKWQCGAELVGASGPVADAELVKLASETLRLLGLQRVDLKLSHIGVLRALVETLSVDEEQKHQMLDRILEGNIKPLLEAASESAATEKFASLLMELKSESKGFLENVRAMCGPHMGAVQSQLDDFIKFIELLEALYCTYQVDMSSARGFEYYTGPTFQFASGGTLLGSGGRYDALIPLMGGEKVTASGFALYVEPLSNCLKNGAGTIPPWKGVSITTEPNPASVKAAFEVASTLREAGFIADIQFSDETSEKWNWRLSVGTSKFTLIDQQGKANTATSVPEVLKLLESKWNG
ncbi:MAG: histidine--tRNA ligase family protein [Chloroflexi bacterium]|nr:histidine--tRNA ligase family protein [Chloroflexota bacterium]